MSSATGDRPDPGGIKIRDPDNTNIPGPARATPETDPALRVGSPGTMADAGHVRPSRTAAATAGRGKSGSSDSGVSAPQLVSDSEGSQPARNKR